MTGGSSGIDPCFVVVGDPCSEFVRTMVRLAREYQVEAVLCDDVYSAVAAAARAAGRSALVVGPMRELAREDNRFFQIAEANSLRCCCLLEKGPLADSVGMVTAVRAGAAMVGDARDVRAVLKDWLATDGHRAVRKSLYDLAEEDLRATEAELNALLGRGTDA
ncbi:MAG: hypothetical protein ACM3VT_09425 [Solirubrobacterales bacterium]